MNHIAPGHTNRSQQHPVTHTRTATPAVSHPTQMTNLPIKSLRPADSPRIAGTDQTHVRLLAECETPLPPILVHKPTLIVIDGMHRLNAAITRGDTTISAELTDIDEGELFLHTVRLNVRHGLPLTLQERKTAVTRLITHRPQLSDRAIAEDTGLSPKTVGRLRKCSAEDNPQPNAPTRMGRDGKAHPLDAPQRRQRVIQALTDHPTAPLRHIAATAGVSVSTAHNVKRRLQENQQQEDHQPQPPAPAPTPSHTRQTPAQIKGTVTALTTDPSLRFTDSGRTLLRFLLTRAVEPTELDALLDTIPPHCAETIADVAQDLATTWYTFSCRLHQRSRQP